MAQVSAAAAAACSPAAARTRFAIGHASASSIAGMPLTMWAQSRRQPRAAAGPTVAVAAPPAPTSNAAAEPPPFDRSDWDAFLRGYQSCHLERSGWAEEGSVKGTIPPELEGTLLRNGPGLFEVGGSKVPQPFDGDGMLAVFAFKGGRCFWANRYVRTEGFLKEQAAQKLLYRGAFNVGNPGGGWLYNPFDLSVKGIANTGVLRWAGKLLALYERDLPYELSTPDLRTLGQTVTVPSQTPYFGSHYRILTEADGARRLIAFNAAEVGSDNRINVLEYDESMALLHRTELDLPGAAMGFFHDCLATPNFYVFLESPMTLDLRKVATKYLWGKACIAECIVYDPSKKTKVHLIARPGSWAGGVRRCYEAPPFFSFHHANAYEVTGPQGQPLVVVDTVANHDGVDLGVNMDTGGPSYYESDEGRGTLTRLVVDTGAGTVATHRLLHRAVEFPSVAPSVVGRPHAHTYTVCSRFPGADAWGPPQGVCKVSVSPEAGVSQAAPAGTAAAEVYYPGRFQFCQEPIFVPRPGGQAEDDGWVLTLVYDSEAHRTRLDILDARSLAAGPVASVRLPHALPPGLHGSWTAEYLGPAPGQAAAPTSYDIRQGVKADV